MKKKENLWEELEHIERKNNIALLISIIVGGIFIFIAFIDEPEPKNFYPFFWVLVIVIIFTFYYGKKHKGVKAKIGKHEKFYGVKEK
ncbi:MAG: hypothetical protein Q8R47_04825 [Nanoarchaeota archaeon]|nr:hypothetical protein [Nanoarchaeota archaeon]